VFSELDLRKGYYQVPVRSEDIPKTVIITPFGFWEFLHMLFGFENVAQSFQRLMDRLMAGLDFVCVYLNDILIASLDQQTHLHHLRLVLERLREGGLLLVQGRQPGIPGVTGCWLAACSHSLLMSRPSWRSLIHWTPLSCRDFWA
jgi:hypothetical protein